MSRLESGSGVGHSPLAEGVPSGQSGTVPRRRHTWWGQLRGRDILRDVQGLQALSGRSVPKGLSQRCLFPAAPISSPVFSSRASRERRD